MKNNLIIILILFIITSCSIVHHEEKFVNPLFYKKMVSGSALNPWDVKITPTTYYTENQFFPGEGITEQCELKKNTETEVILKCFDPFDEDRKKWLIENRPGVFDDKDGLYRYYIFELHTLTEEEDPIDMFYIKGSTYLEDTPYLISSRGYSIDTPRK